MRTAALGLPGQHLSDPASLRPQFTTILGVILAGAAALKVAGPVGVVVVMGFLLAVKTLPRTPVHQHQHQHQHQHYRQQQGPGMPPSPSSHANSQDARTITPTSSALQASQDSSASQTFQSSSGSQARNDSHASQDCGSYSLPPASTYTHRPSLSSTQQPAVVPLLDAASFVQGGRTASAPEARVSVQQDNPSAVSVPSMPPRYTGSSSTGSSSSSGTILACTAAEISATVAAAAAGSHLLGAKRAHDQTAAMSVSYPQLVAEYESILHTSGLPGSQGPAQRSATRRQSSVPRRDQQGVLAAKGGTGQTYRDLVQEYRAILVSRSEPQPYRFLVKQYQDIIAARQAEAEMADVAATVAAVAPMAALEFTCPPSSAAPLIRPPGHINATGNNHSADVVTAGSRRRDSRSRQGPAPWPQGGNVAEVRGYQQLVAEYARIIADREAAAGMAEAAQAAAAVAPTFAMEGMHPMQISFAPVAASRSRSESFSHRLGLLDDNGKAAAAAAAAAAVLSGIAAQQLLSP